MDYVLSFFINYTARWIKKGKKNYCHKTIAFITDQNVINRTKKLLLATSSLLRLKKFKELGIIHCQYLNLLFVSVLLYYY